jgi:serine/threonine protein kinase/Tol biopolymer transport system component
LSIQPGTRLGPYEIVSRLGAGGMGEVYRARDTRPELARDVAIKVLLNVAADPDRRKRFEVEARTTGSLNHPNILAIYDVGVHDDTLYLVEEFLDGTTLREPLERGPLPPRKAVEYARAIAQGLAAAHGKGIVHRDLKPENVMITADGRVKILDFGLAKLQEAAEVVPDSLTRELLTGSGKVLGTVAYMSPEQVRGKTVDHRSDLFSLGVMLYEMLAGVRPFRGETTPDTQSAILSVEPRDLSAEGAIPPALERVLRRCLEKLPEQRFQSASDLAFALDTASTSSSAVAIPSTDRRVIRKWGTVASIAAAAGVGLAIGWAIASRRPSPAPVDRAAIHFTQTLPTVVATPSAVALSSPDPALSPNGRHLAYVAGRVRGGETVLWIRSFDALDARPIDGTDGANYPFWSPDSTSVGFFAGNKLKVFSLEAARLREVCDAPNGRGGTWNTQDVILFTAGANSGIARVSAGGGQPAAVTTPGAGERSHRFPFFLPDGRLFLYWSQRDDGGSIFLGSLDGGAPVRLVDSMAKAEHFAGHLLYLDGTTLTTRPFDAAGAQLGASSFALASNVLRSQANGSAAFSVSANGMLTYRTLSSDIVQLSRFDRLGRRAGTIGEAGPWVQMALSPSGRQLAVQRDRTAASDLWLFDLVRSVSSRFTVDGGNNGPVWSPDGSEIAFRNNRRLLNEVFRQPLVGGTAVAWDGVPSERLEDWSRDGKYLLMGQATGSILAVPLQGGGKPIVVVPPGSTDDTDESQISPDGRWVTYNSAVSGTFQIYLQPFPGPGERVTVSSNGGVQAKWRADGRELFYLSFDGTIMSVEVAAGSRPDVGTPRPLFRTRLNPVANVDQYVVTADGQQFILIEPLADAPLESLTIINNWTTLVRK